MQLLALRYSAHLHKDGKGGDCVRGWVAGAGWRRGSKEVSLGDRPLGGGGLADIGAVRALRPEHKHFLIHKTARCTALTRFANAYYEFPCSRLVCLLPSTSSDPPSLRSCWLTPLESQMRESCHTPEQPSKPPTITTSHQHPSQLELPACQKLFPLFPQ